MARAARSAQPLLPLPSLLSLLSLSWAPTGAETEPIVVLAPTQVRGFLGDNTTLLCKLQTQEHFLQVTLVTWMRQDPMGRSHSIAVFHPQQGPSFPEPGRLEFVAARPGEELRDASLTVRGLRAEDEANYTCHFATFPQGSKSNYTQLRVLAQPQNKAEPQEVQFNLLSQEPVPMARCISVGGRPPARISWSLDGKANTSQEPGPLPGTFTVTSFLTLTPSSQMDGKNVTCSVEHESFQEPVLLPVTLTVYYPPEVSISGYDDDWYLGQSEATLKCIVHSNPAPTEYNWNTSMGPLPSSAVAQGNELLIHPVDESINTTFICHVTNALGIGKAEKTILLKVRPLREKSYPALTTVIIIVGGILVLAFLVLIYFLSVRCSHREHYSPSANGGVSYSAVNCNVSSPQDGPTESTR